MFWFGYCLFVLEQTETYPCGPVPPLVKVTSLLERFWEGGELEFQKLLFHRIIISRCVLRETNSVIEASHCINLKTKYFWIVRKG